MKRRGFLFGIGSLAFYREFVRENETVYLGSTLQTSDYSRVSIKNCKIKRAPWFDGGPQGIMIHLNSPCEIIDNVIYNA